MQTEATSKSSSDERTEELNFTKRKDAVKQLERILTSHQEKPYFAHLELPKGGAVNAFSYKGVTTISNPEFVVHVRKKEYEFSFEANYARQICKSQSQQYFEESTLMKVLASNSILGKLPEQKFEELAVVFSALNDAKVRQLRISRLRVDGDNMRLSVRSWREQLDAINLINKLESEGTSPKNAVYKVLEDIGTNDLVKACYEYGFKVEGDIASSIWNRESAKHKELYAFMGKWEAKDGSPLLALLNLEVKSLDADLCKLQIRRRIVKDEKSVRITEDRIKSLERDGVPEDEFLKEQYLGNLKYERAEFSITQRNLQNIRNLEKAVEVLFPNELAKP